MRIVQLLAYFWPHEGGTETFCRSASRELARRGHEVFVVTSDLTSTTREVSLPREVLDGFTIHRLSGRLIPQRLPILFGLEEVLANIGKIDIAHVHTPYPTLGFQAHRAMRKLGIPYVVSHQCDYTSSWSLYSLILNRFLLQPLLANACRIICTTESYAKTSKILKYHLRKIQTVPLCCEPQFFTSPRTSNTMEILFVGRLYWYKGLDILIHAFARISARLPEARLRIAGRGPFERELRHLIAEMRLDEKVDLVGYVPDSNLPGLYARSDLLVLPSYTRREAFGNVLIESLAAGKPIIAANIPGVEEVVRESGGGLLVRPRDPEDLTDKMMRLLTDRSLSERLGSKGRRWIESNLNIRRIVDQLESTYTEALSQKGQL